MAKKITDEDLRLNIIVNGDTARKQILDTKKELDRLVTLQKEQQEAVKQMEKDGTYLVRTTGYEKAKKAVETLSQAIDKQKESLETLERQQEINTMTMDELSRHIRQTSIALRKADPGTSNWKELNEELKNSKIRMKELSDQSKATGGIMQQLSSIKAGALAAFAAIAGAIRGISRFVAKIADFEQANANLSTIIGKSVKEIERLTNAALKLGRTTEYTASQVTLLQTELAKLGFKEADILRMEEPVLHFATALGASLPDAAALAGATLRMFGLRAGQTGDALSVLTQGANNSALSFEYFQTAMSIVGPVAKTFGFSLRDTVALLGTLSNAGFDASMAATATRNILLNLADSSGKLATALGGPVRTLPELMDGLQRLKAQGIDLATTLELTDKRSVSAFSTFLDGADAALTLRDSLEEVGGVLERTANERMDTLQGSTKLLQSAWEGLILSFRNSTGPIKSVVDWLTKLVTAFTNLPGMGTEKGYSRLFGERFEQWGGSTEMIEMERAVRSDELDALQARYDSQSKLGRFFSGSGKKLKRARTALAGFDLAAAPFLEAGSGTEPATVTPVAAQPTGGSGSGEGGNLPNRPRTTGTWSLENDAAYLAAKAALTRSFNEGAIKEQQEYQERLYALEVSSLTARLALGKEKGAERARLENQLQDTVKKHAEDSAKRQEEERKQAEVLAKEGAEIIAASETDKTTAAMAGEEARYQAEKKKFQETKLAVENQAAVLEAIERKHQNNLLKIRIDAESKEFSRKQQQHDIDQQLIRKRYTQEISALKPNSGKIPALTRDMNAELVKSDLKYLEELRGELQKIMNSGKFDGAVIPEEVLQKYDLQLQQTITKINELTAAQKKNEAGMFSGTGKGSLFGVSQDQWNQFFANIDSGKMKAEDLANALTAMGGLAQEGFKLASQAISLTNAKENEAFKQYQKSNEKKRKSLRDRLDAGLMSQAQYDAEVSAMEEEERARQEELQLKQAERAKKMNLVQAIINTALGVTKTLAEWGIPWGIAPAAIMAAMGAAQVAMIAAQPVTGAEEGGLIFTKRKQDGRTFPARLSPNKRGFIDAPTVLVGENGGEYVIPAEGLDNPTLRPLLNTMETARRAGTLRSLNFEAVYPAGSAVGRASGGFTAPSGIPAASGGSVPSAPASTAASDRRLVEAIELLNRRLKDPIRADVSLLGRNGILAQQEKYDRARGRGR